MAPQALQTRRPRLAKALVQGLKTRHVADRERDVRLAPEPADELVDEVDLEDVVARRG